MMMGEVSEVIGISGNHIAEMEGESWSRMLLRFENNAVGVLTCHNFLCPSAPPGSFASRVQRRASNHRRSGWKIKFIQL